MTIMQNGLWRKLYSSPDNSRRKRNPITMEDYQHVQKRPPVSTQFPSRYGYLPDINSPRTGEGALVPIGQKGYRPPSEIDSDERVRQLEVRLNVAEKSNRALLEEVLRLQGEVKATNRRNEDLIREERGSRHNLESAMKINNELITQLSARIKEAEDKLSEEKTALSSLVNHTKGVEQAVRSSQNELIAKKDVQSGRILEMRNELDSLLSSKEQLERITLQLADELRTLKIRLEQQSSDFSSVSNDLKTRSKRLEEESRNQSEELDTLRKNSTIQSQSEHQTTQLRGQVETRLVELREVLVDLRAKQETEISDRRGLEQSMTTKIHELQQQLSEVNRKREENMHKMDLLLREKEHSAQADRINLNSKVADTVEDVNKRLLGKEIKMREEMQDRYLQLERLVQQEQQQRREYERSAREDNDRKLALVKHAGEEGISEVRELMKMDRVKLNGTLKKLDESISIVEKQTLENKKSFEKVMSAEISQRKHHEQSTTDKLDSVNEKLQIATSSLQQSIGGLTQGMSQNIQKQSKEWRQMMHDHKEATTRAMTDLDARINFMKSRMNEFEEKLEARVATPIKSRNPTPSIPSPPPPPKSPKLIEQPPVLNPEATSLLAENLREKVEGIAMWQDTTQQTIKEMSISLVKIPEEVYAVQEKQQLMKNEMDSRVTAESDKRTQDIEALKQEIEALKSRRDPNPATQQDISNVQASLRKMADSIQTVKTVLGMKIQSEQKLRADDVQKLQDEIAILRTALEPLVKKPLPRSFIKNSNPSNAGKDTPDVNNHSVANAYRWLKWKSRLMFILWKIRTRKTTVSQSPDPGRPLS